MTKEMMRPCTLRGQTFDACDFNMDYFEVFRHEGDCNYRVYFLNTKIATVYEYADSYPIYRQAITTIAEALNAPVVLTKEVYENLPIDMYQLHYIDSYKPDYIYLARYNKTLKKWTFRTGMTLEPFDVPIHKISGCSQVGKDYLLQFTLDGKRKETE